MKQAERDRERELAEGVKAAHEELVAAMAEPMKHGELPDDVARRLLKADTVIGCFLPGQRAVVEKALAKYTDAVNALWLHAENTGVTGRIVSTWLRANHKNLAEISRDEYGAEATFAMRRAVANFRPGPASLFTYATSYVDAALRAYRGQALSAVELPDGVARNTYASNRTDVVGVNLDEPADGTTLDGSDSDAPGRRSRQDTRSAYGTRNPAARRAS